jgi:hypothetical protein
VRFRYFDPLQQSTVEGDLDDSARRGADQVSQRVTELVTTVRSLRRGCSPALEFASPDGTSLVLGVEDERAVILWTDEGGTTSHSVGGPSEHGIVFDFFGAYTELPGGYALPLDDALVAVGGYVADGGSPAVRLLVD